jgi:uncharacterized membrane protein YuzA (DUF378 family)
MGSNNFNSRARAKYLTQIKSPLIIQIPRSAFLNPKTRDTITRPAFIAASIALISLIIGVESLQNQNLFWGPLHDSAHTYAMFLITWLLLRLFSSAASNESIDEQGVKATNSVLIIGGVFLGGIAIEIIQPYFGRSASFLDIYYNLVGIGCAGGVFALSLRKSKAKARHVAAYTAIALMLASSLFLPVLGAYTLRAQEQSLPQLLNFEDAWQQRLWRTGGTGLTSLIKAPSGWEENQSTALQVTFNPGKYPGFNFAYPPKTWSGYSHLSFEVFSKLDTDRKLTLRIHDDAHSQDYSDRFNRTLEIKPGLNKIEIPMSEIQNAPRSRAMALDEIAGMALFMVQPEGSPSLYFDNLTLHQ